MPDKLNLLSASPETEQRCFDTGSLCLDGLHQIALNHSTLPKPIEPQTFFLLYFWINFKFYLLSSLLRGLQFTLIDKPPIYLFSLTSLWNRTVLPTISLHVIEVKGRLDPVTNLFHLHSSQSHKWEYNPSGYSDQSLQLVTVGFSLFRNSTLDHSANPIISSFKISRLSPLHTNFHILFIFCCKSRIP